MMKRCNYIKCVIFLVILFLVTSTNIFAQSQTTSSELSVKLEEIILHINIHFRNFLMWIFKENKREKKKKKIGYVALAGRYPP